MVAGDFLSLHIDPRAGPLMGLGASAADLTLAGAPRATRHARRKTRDVFFDPPRLATIAGASWRGTMLDNPNAHLGIVCGVLAFSMGIVTYAAINGSVDAAPAWNVIWIVTVAAVGGKTIDGLQK